MGRAALYLPGVTNEQRERRAAHDEALRAASPIVWLFVWPAMLGLLVLVSRGC